jgi:Dynein heavy chain, N-terminal region 2.
MSQVGDNQCLLQSIKNSPNYESFADRASIWETRLADLDVYLHNLNQIQRKWVSLFVSSDSIFLLIHLSLHYLLCTLGQILWYPNLTLAWNWLCSLWLYCKAFFINFFVFEKYAVYMYLAVISGGCILSPYLVLEHCHRTRPDSEEWTKIFVLLWEMLLKRVKLCPCAELAVFTRFCTHFWTSCLDVKRASMISLK